MARRTIFLGLSQRFVKMMSRRWQTQKIRSLDRGPGPPMREHSLEARTHRHTPKLTARKKDKTPRRTDAVDTMKHQRDSPLRLLCFTSPRSLGACLTGVGWIQVVPGWVWFGLWRDRSSKARFCIKFRVLASGDLGWSQKTSALHIGVCVV